MATKGSATQQQQQRGNIQILIKLLHDKIPQRVTCSDDDGTSF
uniref:Uncharacterized protein n=1 Tax=Arundo donax TaxID=35708 RepID=A0A0A9FDH4_ARUDO